MFDLIYEMLGLVGVDMTVPTTLGGFLQWFIVCIVGLCVIWFVFRMFRYLVGLVIGQGRMT